MYFINWGITIQEVSIRRVALAMAPLLPDYKSSHKRAVGAEIATRGIRLPGQHTWMIFSRFCPSLSLTFLARGLFLITDHPNRGG